MSALCVAVLIIVLFLTVLIRIEFAWLVSGFFIGSMLLLIGSVVVLIHDINQFLAALKLELRPRKSNTG